MYQKTINIGLGILIIVFIISLIDRKIDVDDSMLGEHAYWLAKEGKVKTVLFWGNGIGWAQEQYHYHKLFILTGAFFIKIFSFSLPTLKSVSLLFSVLFLIILYKHLISLYKKQTANNLFILSSFIIILNANFFDKAYMFRPEIMVMTLGFISYHFLNKWEDSSKLQNLYLSAIFAGLSTFTHLNGLIFIFAGGAYLIYKLKFKELFIFGTISILTTLLYFYNINSTQEFQLFWHQFTNDPNLAKKDFSIFEPVYKLMNEHKRFFHSPKEAVFSILFFLSVGLGFKNYTKLEKQMLIYLFLLMIGLAGLAHGVSSKYAILYYPYMVIIIARTILNLKKHSLKLFAIINVVLFSYAIIESVYIYKLIDSRLDVSTRNRFIGEHLNKGASVFGFENFIFNEINNFTIKSALPLAYEHGFKSKPLPEQQKRYFELADIGENQFIIADTIYKNDFNDSMIRGLDLKLGNVFYNYQLIFMHDGIYIFEKTDK